MKVINVLSHRMNEDGILSEESLARAQLATKLYVEHDCKYIITSGWAYRDDYLRPIGDVMADYIKTLINLSQCKVYSDTNARDTVGDAYFLRRKLSGLGLSNLMVVTSDYHVHRTEKIFRSFFCTPVSVSVFGVKSKRVNDRKTLSHEQKSLDAFEKTFSKANFSSDSEILEILLSHHPLYSGDVYPKFTLEQ